MYADPRSIWLKNGMGGVKLDVDKDGNIINVLDFSLNIIHGPRKDLTFAAAKRHKFKHSDFFYNITEDLLWHLHHRSHIIIVRDEGKDFVDPCRIEIASVDESLLQ